MIKWSKLRFTKSSVSTLYLTTAFMLIVVVTICSIYIAQAFAHETFSFGNLSITPGWDFEPQEESAGLYRAIILPTQVGSYSIVLIGSIDSQTINSELRIEDVDDTAKH